MKKEDAAPIIALLKSIKEPFKESSKTVGNTLVGTHIDEVDTEKLENSIKLIHPIVSRIYKDYPPIKVQHISSIGNSGVNYQIFLDDFDRIQKVITRDYHIENMIYFIRSKIK